MCTPRLLGKLSPARPASGGWFVAGAACLTILAVAACGDDNGGTSPPSTRTYGVAIQQGDTQVAFDGTPVAIAPTILVTDEHGAPATGIGVAFSVLSGNGTVTAPPLTAAGGLASADWTLGWLRGNDTSATQRIRATVTGTDVVGDTVTFLALAQGNHWDSLPWWFPWGMSLVNGGVINGKLYMVDGYDGASRYVMTEIMNPATGYSTSGAFIPNYVWDAGTAVLNNMLYIAGGAGYPTAFATRRLQVYDPATDTWAVRAPMASTRVGARAAVVGGRFYTMGGLDTLGAPLGSMEAYDPATNTWTARAPMPTPRRHMGVAVLDGKIWVVGGLDSLGAPLPTVEIYDPVANSWTTGTPLSVARQGPAVVVLNGMLYAISGDAVPAGTMPTTEAWNPVTSTWIPRHDYRWHCWNSLAGIIGGKLIIFGGDDGTTWYHAFAVYIP